MDSVTASLLAQSQAVHNLYRQYSSPRPELSSSLDLLYNTSINNGKIVFCGVGKSFKIGAKLVATLTSLSILAANLHPGDALHGDLGLLRPNDCLVLLSASGKSKELLTLLSHVTNPVILVTCDESSELARSSRVNAVLHTELPSQLKEDTIHGVPAPTISATLCMVLMDGVNMALAEMLTPGVDNRRKQFSINHPGGSIGETLSQTATKRSSWVDDIVGEEKNENNHKTNNVNSTKLLIQQLYELDELKILRIITRFDRIEVEGKNIETKQVKKMYVEKEWKEFKEKFIREMI